MMTLGASPLQWACELIRYSSITPQDAGLFQDLMTVVQPLGGNAHCIQWGDTKNLYIRWGTQSPHVCFAGHIDVVPPGCMQDWKFSPFEPTQADGYLYGRGAADMKGAVGCFLFSLIQHLKTSTTRGSYSILLTSDEEGPALDGIQKMIPWLEEKQEKIHHILIGEPTGSALGSVLQIGRRGSITGTLAVEGVQGHVAYPDLCHNPIPALVACLSDYIEMPLDEGDMNFEPSRVNIVGLEPSAIATNVSPSYAKAQFGIRFNPHHTPETLEQHLHNVCHKHCREGKYVLDIKRHGSWFVTQDMAWIHCVEQAMQEVTGNLPTYTTRGGTTDGRFLSALAPVLELGMPETTIHQVNERVLLQDFDRLSAMYTAILQRYQATFT